MLTVRLKGCPANVVGPRTRWVILLEHYGKNGGKAALVAKCLTNGNRVVFYDGRENATARAARLGFTVAIGTIQCRIMSAAVAQGVAEFVGTPEPYE